MSVMRDGRGGRGGGNFPESGPAGYTGTHYKNKIK